MKLKERARSLASEYWPPIKQLLTEFWIPLSLAGIWTAYDYLQSPLDKRTPMSTFNFFGVTFFSLSWSFSQWHRVKKQRRTDSGLTAIQAAVDVSLARIETTTSDVIGNITGGDSVCVFVPPPGSE